MKRSSIRTSRRFVRGLAVVATVALFVHAPGSFAQDGSDGSVYSRFGIGELQSYGSPQVVAMGGAGSALGGNRYANHLNPAALAHRTLTGAAAGLSYETIQATDRFQNVGRLSHGTLKAIQFSFPIITSQLGIGAGLEPFSTRRYRIQVEDEFDDDGATIPYTVDFLGSGGIHKASVAAGLAVVDGVSVGLEGQMLFGLLEESRSTTFLQDGYAASTLTNSVRVRGFTGRVGVLATINGLRTETDQLSVGAQFTLPTSMFARRVVMSGRAQERDTLLVFSDGDIELPFSASVGLAYAPSQRWLIVGDARYEPWASFNSTIPLPGYDPDGESGLVDRTRLAAGFEFVPGGGNLLASYLRRTGYRLGFYFDPVYLTGGEARANTIAITGGLSLPTRVPGTRIDLNLEVGTRGMPDVGLVRERFIRFGLNLNVGERWFLKTRLG